jgi:SAM-dependent methyltransferase
MKNPFKNISFDECKSCPLCDGNRFTQILAGDRYDMKIQTCICDDCHFVFTNPYPSKSDIDLFYSNNYWDIYFKSSSNSGTILDARKSRCEKYLAFILPHLQLKKEDNQELHFIDIGGGEGVLTGLIKEQGLGKTYLFEPSDSERTIATDSCNADFITSDIDELCLNLEQTRKTNDLTIVTCTHVLEHVSSFEFFFQQLGQIVRDKDIVYIDVPDVMKYDHIKEIHIAHKWHFSKATLAKLFFKYGYHAVELDSYSPIQHPHSVRAIFRKGCETFDNNYGDLDNNEELISIFKNIEESEIIWNSKYRKFRRYIKGLINRFS